MVREAFFPSALFDKQKVIPAEKYIGAWITMPLGEVLLHTEVNNRVIATDLSITDTLTAYGLSVCLSIEDQPFVGITVGYKDDGDIEFESLFVVAYDDSEMNGQANSHTIFMLNATRSSWKRLGGIVYHDEEAFHRIVAQGVQPMSILDRPLDVDRTAMALLKQMDHWVANPHLLEPVFSPQIELPLVFRNAEID